MKVFGLLISAVFLVSFVNGQTSDGKCGPQGGNQNCGTSFCCSQYGYCGTSTAYCGTGCQPGFGKCNSGSTTSTTSTTSTSTSTTPTSTSSAPPTSTTKAVAVTKCKAASTVAITFDDGPSEFTHTLLDKLKAKNYKATFFINGNNYGCIYDYADIIKRAMDEGHQIASHTWSHPDLATLTEAQITTEMKKLDDALVKITGKKPVYMRPPFGSGVDNDKVMTTLGKLGYKVIIWDLDTNDWQGVSTNTALNVYRNAAGPTASHIALNHDTIKNTAENMGPQAFDIMSGRGFKLTTVGECMGDTADKWYIKVGDPKPRDNTWVC